ncbi:GIY-YIG nuclease family protein [Paraburkholderia ginsengisoli]|uniref:GIY-YIG nuclease family protein n=1 Tax=Paraburkholderia ginsengisoli TaxID=311231 RepID=A0A7T4N025_9BURK|nr:GIY-YIG nuclease family protein [Paraburkholderia ginsengisoli]QQC62772.1 GIY-YIG nuclease family protein [Paraburkholderia ginsengisoli]
MPGSFPQAALMQASNAAHFLHGGRVKENCALSCARQLFFSGPLEFDHLNFNAFERLVHHVFAATRWDIDVMDRFGKAVKPREWFLLQLSIVEQAVPFIVDGLISGFRYDHRSCSIVKSSNQPG